MTDLIRSESTSPPLPLSHIQYSCIDIDTPQSLLVTATRNLISASSLQRCTESHLGPGHQSDMRNNFPLFSSALMSGNENCQEVRNLIKVMMMLEVVGKIWEVREGREGEGWLLITDIQNISTKHKAGKVVVKTWFNVFITLSPHQAREASSSYSPGYFSRNQISFRFLTANKVRELQRMVPPVSAEL